MPPPHAYQALVDAKYTVNKTTGYDAAQLLKEGVKPKEMFNMGMELPTKLIASWNCLMGGCGADPALVLSLP